MKALFPIISLILLSSCSMLNPFQRKDQEISRYPASGLPAEYFTDPHFDWAEYRAEIDARRAEEAEARAEADRARDAEIRAALSSRDLTMGMTQEDVISSWGEPREASHDTWSYYDGLSTRWGLGPKRVIYFENGRVVGWETVDR